MLAAAAGVFLALSAAPPAVAESPLLLPDLRQAPVGCAGGWDSDPLLCTDWDVCAVADASSPSAHCVTSGHIAAVRLRFTASEENIGDGPLLFYAHRDSTAQPTMTVRQAFQTVPHGPIPASFTAAQRPSRTTAYYEPAPAHVHWHLLNFERFQLRTQSGDALVTDRKNGFCLGDRYAPADADMLAYRARDDDSPEGKLHTFLVGNMCGHADPNALDVTEGISVGSGDDYKYDVDFQWLDITKVPSGVYTVVNTVNPDHTLIESDYNNDSSSLAISIRWPTRKDGLDAALPVVSVLRSCPGRERCPV
ncbi:MAG: lysyl oxidase [Kutzneria sp.]|nr:lysyl oxidase [Kutzneria sp.]MBV9846819.1 lysyl oxidase [Kutzneria sp.]